MNVEKMGAVVLDFDIEMDEKALLNQILPIINAVEKDAKVSLQFETDKFNAELDELRKSIDAFVAETSKSLQKVGKSLGAKEYIKEFANQHNQLADIVNQKIDTNTIPELSKGLETFAVSVGKAGTDFSSVIKGLVVNSSKGGEAIKQVGKEAKKASEDIITTLKEIEIFESRLKLLQRADKNVDKKVISSLNTGTKDIREDLDSFSNRFKSESIQKKINEIIETPASRNYKKDYVENLAEVYEIMNKIQRLHSAYTSARGGKDIDKFADLKQLDEINKRYSDTIKKLELNIKARKEKLVTLPAPEPIQKNVSSDQAVISSETQKKAAIEATTAAIKEQQQTAASDKENIDSVSKEKSDLDALKEKLIEVKNAIEDKTKAFTEEGTVVDNTVQGEIAKLKELEKQIREIIGILLGTNNSPNDSGTPIDQTAITQELENLRTQLMGMEPFKVQLLPAINIDEWVKEINLQISQLGSHNIKAPQSPEGNKRQKASTDPILQKTAAYERLIATEERYQQLQYKQVFDDGLNKRETAELNKLTAARNNDVAIIKKTNTNIAEHISLNTEWLDKQKHVTDAIFQNAEALEKQRAKANTTKKALDGYNTLANTEQKFQEMLAKRGGTDVQGSADANLNPTELNTFLNIEQARLAAIKNISAAKNVGIDLTASELKYEEQRVSVAEKLARIEAANNSRSKLDPVVNAYQTLLNTEESFQVLEQKRKGVDANLPAGELRKYIELSEIRRQAVNEISDVTSRTEEQAQAEAQYNTYAQKTIDTITRLNNAEQQRLQKKHGNFLFDAADIESAKTKIENHIRSIGATMNSSLDWSQSLNGYIVSLERGDGIIEKTKFHLEETKDGAYQVYKTIAQTTKATSTWEKAVAQIGNRFKALGAYLASFVSVYEIWGQFKRGLNVVRDLDTQLTEMLKVSDESVASLERYQKETFNVAKEVGSTASVIQSSTADYMRLGKSLKEASELAKNTSILMNVSEFQNINDATESMIAMTQAYKELSSLDIIDKLNLAGEPKIA